jgi:hypothetical protein
MRPSLLPKESLQSPVTLCWASSLYGQVGGQVRSRGGEVSGDGEVFSKTRLRDFEHIPVPLRGERSRYKTEAPALALPP